MTSKSRFTLGVVLIVAAVAGALIFTQLRKKPALRMTIDDIQPAEPRTAPAREPGDVPREEPRGTAAAGATRHPDPAGPGAAPQGTGESAEASDGGGIGPQLPVARKWKLQAQEKQLTLYRKTVEANVRALDKLGATIERLKREGATATQVEQIQRRLQQMREADTRMRLRLQEIEKELAAVQEGEQPK